MTSSCELRFDNISIIDQKEFVPDIFIYLFQESDRKTIQISDDEFEDGYFAPRAAILQRLDLAGHTSERSRQVFEQWLAEEQERYADYLKRGHEWATPTANDLQSLNYEEWKRRARETLLHHYDFPSSLYSETDQTDVSKRPLNDDWLFFAGYNLDSIRCLLEALPEVQEVSLDIGPLISAGWIDEDAKICAERREPGAEWRSILQLPVIIAEGSSDILVLKRSLQRLYPHLTDYVTFFDFEGSNSDGGVSYLVKFLKAFAAARISTLILAVFDNDAVGLEGFAKASQLQLPENIRVMRLPDIDLARYYPTVGPQGTHEIDVNGKAVSIELFLGRHNLMTCDGVLIPVFWNNYVQTVQSYQGVIQGKKDILERFLDETNLHDETVKYCERFPELTLLWEHIFKHLKPAV